MKTTTGIRSRHFVHKHPLFRRQKTDDGVHWRDSVYYCWWEFLRRSSDYKKTCDQNGKGKYAALYADFGNVHTVENFRTWWSDGDRGAKLFAEPQIPITVTLMSRAEAASLPADTDPATLILVAIPLSLPKATIMKRVNAILRSKHTRKRGQRLHCSSAARYPVTKQFSIAALKSILRTYDLKQKKPEIFLWEIGQLLRLGGTITEEELANRSWEFKEKKFVLASAASRKLKQARRIIDGVTKGRFPEI